MKPTLLCHGLLFSVPLPPLLRRATTLPRYTTTTVGLYRVTTPLSHPPAQRRGTNAIHHFADKMRTSATVACGPIGKIEPSAPKCPIIKQMPPAPGPRYRPRFSNPGAANSRTEPWNELGIPSHPTWDFRRWTLAPP